MSHENASMNNPFTTHPYSVNETYFEHCLFAFGFGIKMTLGGIAALVHAVFPFLFVTTAGRLCDELQLMRQNSPGRKKSLQTAPDGTSLRTIAQERGTQ